MREPSIRNKRTDVYLPMSSLPTDALSQIALGVFTYRVDTDCKPEFHSIYQDIAKRFLIERMH